MIASKNRRMTSITKKIDELIPDIEKLLLEGSEVSDERAEVFGSRMKTLIQERLKREPRAGTLRMSNLGKPSRQLWYEVNTPEDAEPLHPNTYMKFLFGDVIEVLLLFLAEQAGHTVEGQQDTLHLEGVEGHRDAVIDGMTVDAKSASPYSFKKFENHLKPEEDAFGYIQQINNYIECGQEDPLVVDKDRGAFFVMNKVTGDMTLDIHEKSKVPIKDIIDYKKNMVAQPEPPDRCFEPEPMGKSGNMKLGINCSYCPFKFKCWEGLRGFHYSNGPIWLSHVEEEPRVPEMEKPNSKKKS